MRDNNSSCMEEVRVKDKKKYEPLDPCLILLMLIKISNKHYDFLEITSLDKIVNDVEKIDNYIILKFLASLVIKCPISMKIVTKSIRSYFRPKNWEQNENSKKQVVVPIVQWYYYKSITNI